MSTEMILRTIDDVTSLAQIAIASKLTKLSRVEEAAVILMTGRELGLQPMQSLRGIYVVEGKPTLSADMMVAVIRGSGLCESWRIVESTAERCTITTRRKGEQHDATRTWTKADATLAGVAGKDTWRKYPAAMLRHRCAADLARQEYPDVLLGLYDPDELGADAAAVQQPSVVSVAVATPTLPAPPTWADDLAACTTLRDVRACYARHAGTADHTGDAEPDDVRAWCAEHNLIATAAEVTAILSTLPDAALVILDDVHADEEHETTVRIERVARRVARERSTWDAHSAEATAKIVARSYAHATGTDLKAAGAALKRAIENGNDDPTPPTGTDGPAREPGSDDGDEASADAWRETAEGIVQHVAGLGARHIENSGRLHLRAVPEALQLHAVHVYGGRLQRLSYDGSSSKPWDECVATVERWLREGPRVTELRPRTRTAPARRAVG